MTTKTKPNARSKKKVSNSGKPKASGTKNPAKAQPKAKRKREAVTPARLPVRCAEGWANPLLVHKRNKRAMCIAFAHILGGAKGTPEQDTLLQKCVRESGVLWKAGINIENFDKEDGNHHLSAAEQSGRGYANRCGRGRHDDYMEQFPDKVADCLDFAKAFVNIIKLEGEAYEKVREAEMLKVPDLLVKLAEAKAKNASKAKKAKTSAKPAANKVVTKTPAKGKKTATAKRPTAKKVEVKKAPPEAKAKTA